MNNMKSMSFMTQGIEYASNLIGYQVFNRIKDHFPSNFFKYRQLFTPNTIKNIYAHDKKIQEIKTLKPRMIGLTDFESLNERDEDKPGLVPTRSEYADPNQNYTLLYLDSENNRIMGDFRRIRMMLDISFITETMEDQITLFNLIKNKIKLKTPYYFENIIGRFRLPNKLMHTLAIIMYGTHFTKEMFSAFDDRLLNCSKETIIPYYLRGNEDNRLYYYNQLNRGIYTLFPDDPEIEKGERKGRLYDGWRVSIKGFYYIYIPTEFILYVPEMIYNMRVDRKFTLEYDEVKLTDAIIKELINRNKSYDIIEETISSTDREKLIKDLNINKDDFKLEKVKKLWNPEYLKYYGIGDEINANRVTNERPYNTYEIKKIIHEENIYLDSPNEEFNFINWLEDLPNNQKSNYVLLIIELSKHVDFNYLLNEKILMVDMYEDKYELDKNYYMKTSSNYIISVINSNINKPHTMIVNVNVKKLIKLVRYYRELEMEDTNDK